MLPPLKREHVFITTPTLFAIKMVELQRHFFKSNRTKDIGFREEQLKKLRHLLKTNEKMLFRAIFDDFGKSQFETYISELLLVYQELNLALSNLSKWSKPNRVRTGWANFPAKSFVMPEPLGVVLVIGAWNYPYLLALVPAISAIAAGNTVILKPSELPLRTSQALASLINNHFEADYFRVVEGGAEQTTELLNEHFDKIFFTGSIPVGKIVYQAAAKHLTPVTLELGGKSPTFVLADCNLKVSAKRIAWAKFLNAGQTCVAPDYILVEEPIKEAFLEALATELNKLPKDISDFSGNYTKIINTKHFDRLCNLIDTNKVFYGGHAEREKRLLSPTVLKDITFEDRIMEDEIFGPLLPVLSFANLQTAIDEVKSRPKPLSCYIYSTDKRAIKKILNELSFGGGAVNDSVMQLSNRNLPFGGVGLSGIGSYHGKAGFDTFSHFKSILHKGFGFEPNLKYAPYSVSKLKWIKRLMG